MKKYSFLFSVIGSLSIIAMFFTINYTTSWIHPWFIYPAFAVLWWPLGVYFGQTKKFKLFSVVGSLYISGFLYLVNMITSASFPWFIFPVFGVLWWPLAMLINAKKRPGLFSIVASMLISFFFLITNYITSFDFKWFIFPVFGVLWWPISVLLCGSKKYKMYSIVSTVYITAFLAMVNYIVSPQYTWFYYPVYGLLWWPLSMFLAKKPKLYSLVMSLITVAFLMLINYMNTPDKLWYPYCIFHFIWWPLIMFIGKRAGSLWFSVLGALAVIAYYVLLYFALTPSMHPWYLYIILPAIWWPVSTAYGRKALNAPFQLVSLLIFIGYYTVLNIVLTPEFFWAVNIIYPALWCVMGIYFGNNKKFFAFSVCAAIITIIYFSILNYMTTPNIIWAVYPSFAILWWPLSMYFYKVKKEKQQNAAV